MNWERSGQLAIFAPLLHLLVSFTFLFGYSSGFGGGVGSLFAASDIFSISLSDLMLVYISGGLIPLIMTANTFVPGYKSPAQRLVEKGEEGKDELKKIDRWVKLITYAFLTMVLLTLVPTTFLAWKYDHRVPYAEMNALMAFSVPALWLRYAAKLPTHIHLDRMMAIILTLIGAALILGLSRGQTERRYDRAQFADSRMHCSDFVVLRSVGERFLAIGAKQGRFVIDADCKAVMTFPRRPPFGHISTYDLGRRFLGFDRTPRTPAKASNAIK